MGKQWHFIFLGSKIIVDIECSLEIKRHLLLGKKTMTNLDSILKSRNITLLTKVSIGFSSSHVQLWELDIKKAECQRMDAFELQCWRLLRVPWTTRRSNQSILKEVNPDYSSEGLMPKLKFQYFGQLTQKVNALQKTLKLEKIEG